MCFDSPKFDLLFPGSEVQEGLQENEYAVSLHYLREPPGVLKCKKNLISHSNSSTTKQLCNYLQQVGGAESLL